MLNCIPFTNDLHREIFGMPCAVSSDLRDCHLERHALLFRPTLTTFCYGCLESTMTGVLYSSLHDDLVDHRRGADHIISLYMYASCMCLVEDMLYLCTLLVAVTMLLAV